MKDLSKVFPIISGRKEQLEFRRKLSKWNKIKRMVEKDEWRALMTNREKYKQLYELRRNSSKP